MKRLFSTILAVACFAGTLTFGSFASAETPKQTQSTTFTDITSTTTNSEAIYSLTKLGIINGYLDEATGTYSFKPDGDITRAEFAKVITVAMDIANPNENGKTDLIDIDTHWGKPYIITAANYGIINGFEDKTFKPDENVTYEQAVKMIVCAAGYDVIAKSLGGWPNGYITQGAALKITDGAATSDQTGKVTRGVVAKLMYNLLDVKMPEFDLTTGGIKEGNKTFLQEYKGIVKNKVTIVGVEDKLTNQCNVTLALDQIAVKLSNGNIEKIDYTTYTEDKEWLVSLLGQEVVVYYVPGRTGLLSTLYALDADVTKNQITTVYGEEINNYSNGTVKYYPNQQGSGKTVAFNPATVTVYYNGKIFANNTPGYATTLTKWLDPSYPEFIYGDVKFVDNGADGSIEFVEITDYKYIVASKSPSVEDYKITNKAKFTTPPTEHINEIVLNPDDVHTDITIRDKDGKDYAPTSITANSVLLVASSLDNSVHNVLICKETVTGKIVGVSEDKITINNKQYTVTDYADRYFNDNNISTDTGAQGTFYLDVFGNIVFGVQTAVTQSTSPYVYIIKSVYQEAGDTGTITAFVPSSNSVKTYTLNKKVKFSDGAVCTPEETVTKIRNNIPKDGSGNAISSIVTPDINMTGVGYSSPVMTNSAQVARITVEGTNVSEIALINTSLGDLSNATYSGYDTNVDTSQVVPYKPLAEYNYNGGNVFEQDDDASTKFYVNSSTVYIYVPQNRSETTKYQKRTISNFNTYTPEWVQPYNVNDSKIASLVLVYGSDGATDVAKDTSQIYLLAKEHGLNYSEDGSTHAVNYYKQGSSEVNNQTALIGGNITASTSYTVSDVADIHMADFFRAGTETTGFANAEIVMKYTDVMNHINNPANNSNFSGSAFRWAGTSYADVTIYNVIEVIEDGDKRSLRVTRDGYTTRDGQLVLSETNETIIEIPSDVIIYRVNPSGTEVTPYVEGTDTQRITPDDIKGFRYSSTAANRIGIYSYRSSLSNVKKPKMILIYK